MTSIFVARRLWILVAGVLALSLTVPAHAVTYSFNNFLAGGGGGVDPKKQQIARGSGAQICVDVSDNPGSPASSVRFIIWSGIPQLKSRVTAIAFDTGRHTDLFSSVSVLVPPPSAKAQVVPATPHPFLRSLTPEYFIQLSLSRKHVPGSPSAGGLGPGDSIIVSATLGPGKTFANVMSALNEGINPATAGNGLRVGVIVLYILGGPPPGVATINDDGGFAISAASPQCRSR
jgi:hypothetical protein